MNMKRFTSKNYTENKGKYVVDSTNVSFVWNIKKKLYGGAHIDRLAQYENTGFTPEEIIRMSNVIKIAEAWIQERDILIKEYKNSISIIKSLSRHYDKINKDMEKFINKNNGDMK